jgi:hypothetical protein
MGCSCDGAAFSQPKVLKSRSHHSRVAFSSEKIETKMAADNRTSLGSLAIKNLHPILFQDLALLQK